MSEPTKVLVPRKSDIAPLVKGRIEGDSRFNRRFVADEEAAMSATEPTSPTSCNRQIQGVGVVSEEAAMSLGHDLDGCVVEFDDDKPTKVRVDCPECDGTGGDNQQDMYCAKCNGEGEFIATLLDTASGPVVIGDEARDKAKAQVRDAMLWAFRAGYESRHEDGKWDGTSHGHEFDDGLVDRQTTRIITALFPDGIEVAEAVGVLEDFADHGHPAEMQMRTADNRCFELGDYEGRRAALLAEKGQDAGISHERLTVATMIDGERVMERLGEGRKLAHHVLKRGAIDWCIRIVRKEMAKAKEEK